ncbi:MAG: prolyl oligopeptidase family serine peptidase, partial [Nitriliruptoraceae bacterium]
FTLGVPRSFTPAVGPSGPVVLFLRTDAGDDPVTHLWWHDPRTGVTDKLVDARRLGAQGRELPDEERARRERAREQADGIVAYATDESATMAAFTLGGRLCSVEVATGRVAEQPTVAAAFDPRPSPDGRAIAYHAAGGVHLVELVDGPGAPGSSRQLVAEPGVSWGRAEFIAAEELGRTRGAWWSGGCDRLAVTRVDERDVPAWTITDPARPWSIPSEHRYPAAGTTNAHVSLWVVEVDTGELTEVAWDHEDAEYLVEVRWGHDPLTLAVQPRDQRSVRVLVADPDGGATRQVREWADETWVEVVPGSPVWLQDRLLTVEDRPELGLGGTRALCLDGQPVTPAGLQVRELVAAHAWHTPDGHVVTERRGVVEFLASPEHDPTRIDPYELDLDAEQDAPDRLHSETSELGPGIRRVVAGHRPRGAGVTAHAAPWVETTVTPATPTPTVTVGWSRRGEEPGAGTALHVHPLEVVAEEPVLTARPRWLELGHQGLRAALLLPRDDDGAGRLPVLLDPYGGPHVQRVIAAQGAYLTSQWLADQGFAVLVVDGRGTPGRGPGFEREVKGDLATRVLEDQIDALHAAARFEPRLDLGRVGIRGWSFGGYLAALAVLRRPDVFAAAVAGAPVTDWRLYDTAYTERYLGRPDRDPDAYRVSSLVDGDGALIDAADWDPQRPPSLLLIHGLADDNVVAAHSLRLSAALLADGRAHAFLPLSGVTHMTPQETIAERLLDHQVRFLRAALS